MQKMKKIGLLLIILAAVLFVTSCEKDKSGPFLNESAAAPQITAPTGGTTFVFVEADEVSDSVTFTWTVPEYGYDASVLYALEIAKAGTSFAAPASVANVYKPEAKLSVGDFNMKILTIGGIAGEEADYELRVKSTIHVTVPTLISSTVPVTITPYEKVIIYPKLYVPGDHNGWDQANESTVIYSVGFNDIFEGYLWFKDATTGFKLLKVPAWEEANTIGDPVASGTSGTLQIGSWGGNNIVVNGGIGYYLIKANLVEKTYSWMKTDWGIIGPGQPGGWDTDSNLSYSTTTGLWTATLDLAADKIKFRANDSWDLNYGDNGADKKLELNGSDISVPSAGNYTVTLDLRGPIYKYSLVKN
jgi:starch-binding outer membrane protein SusE/F